MKINFRTRIAKKHYLFLVAISVFFVVLRITDVCFDGVGKVVLKTVQVLIEILAAGMLPAVFVAFLTDWAGCKREDKIYKKYVEDSLKALKSRCEDLPLELLNCINSEKYEENGERHTFCRWSELLYGKDGAKTFSQELKELQMEAERVAAKVDGIDIYYLDAKYKTLKSACEEIERCCMKLRVDIGSDKAKSVYLTHINALCDAVLAVFPKMEKYRNEYNSEMFIEESDM